MNTIQTVKGTFDILPDSPAVPGGSSATWTYVEEKIREVMAQFHITEIRTPMIEQIGLFERGVGTETDIVSKEMFVIPRGDEAFVLRPEVTAPVMRAYLEHRLDQKGGVQRLYYIGPCFRAENPQKGRYRQFHQFGAEFIGTDDPRADVESIAVMKAVYDAFGITDTRLRINTLGGPESRDQYRTRLTAYLEPYEAELSETSRRRLNTNPLRVLDTKLEHERKLLDDAPKLIEVIEDEDRARFETVKGLLADAEIDFVEDPFLVRGLDYYTHTAYELESDALGAQSALGGGGRYDHLAEALGSKQSVPGVGFASGLERLFLALEAQGIELPGTQVPDVFLVTLGEAAQRWGFARAQVLRRRGVRVAFDLKGRSMKAQMREANRQNAPVVIIVGDDELNREVAVVKRMETGEQIETSFAELAEVLLAVPDPR